jgi:hypothetical protein
MLVRDSRTSSANGGFGRAGQCWDETGHRGVAVTPPGGFLLGRGTALIVHFAAVEAHKDDFPLERGCLY